MNMMVISSDVSIFVFSNVPTHIFERSENNVQSIVGEIL